MRRAPAKDAPAPNRYQAATSASKLRGQFYTPEGLVRAVCAHLDLQPGQLILDPSCGDGGFLRGAVALLAERFPTARPAEWLPLLTGFDINPEAVSEARLNVQASVRTHFGVTVATEDLNIVEADPLAQSLPDLLARLRLRAGANHARRIIGNPPYVEAKRLDAATKRQLAGRFPGALRGAPDLYLYFLHACLDWLRPGDRLALVLPNKLLVSANAAAVRERLLDEALLRGLWFATQTDAFSGAGVYPVVLFAGDGAPAVETARINRNGDAFTASAPVHVSRVLYGATGSRAFFLPPEEANLMAILEQLLAMERRVGDVLDIRWTVSFHRAGLREQFVHLTRPDSPHARRFVGGEAFAGNAEVSRYALRWAGCWIDYDEARLRAERNFLPPLSLFDGPKIAICQNSRTLRAAYDEDGYVLKDTFLCGIPAETAHPLNRELQAATALLCSRAAHFFYSHVFHGGHVSGGYLHFLRSFVNDVPAGGWSDETATATADLARRRGAAETPHDRQLLEDEIEGRVCDALHLDPEAKRLIQAWADEDANWQARDRVGLPGRRRSIA